MRGENGKKKTEVRKGSEKGKQMINWKMGVRRGNEKGERRGRQMGGEKNIEGGNNRSGKETRWEKGREKRRLSSHVSPPLYVIAHPLFSLIYPAISSFHFSI